MTDIGLRYMQTIIKAEDHTSLPGSSWFSSFERIEFLTQLQSESGVYLRCLVKVAYNHPSALQNEYDSLTINEVIESTDKESVVDATFSGPLPRLFASFKGIWWTSPTVLEKNILHLTVRGTVEDVKKARSSLNALLSSRYVVTTLTAGLNNPSVMRTLTARQSEVLSAAMRLGYYSSPRRCTQRKVADHLGLRQATVSEHLMSAESKVIHGVYND